MTRAHATILALRLAAVYVWVHAILQVGYVAFTYSMPHDPYARTERLGYELTLLLLVLLGFALFGLAPWLARRMGMDDTPLDSEPPAVVGALGLRVGAVFLFEAGLGHLSRVLYELALREQGGEPGGLAVALVSMVLLVTCGVALFLAAPRLARPLFRAAPPGAPTPRGRYLQAVAFSVLGVWILAWSLPEAIALVSAVWRLAYVEHHDVGVVELLGAGWRWTSAVSTIAQVALGLALFLFGGGLAGFWHVTRVAAGRLQKAGLEPRERHENAGS